jgi:hypothetical protein
MELVATVVTRIKLDQAAEKDQTAHVARTANHGQTAKVTVMHAAAASAAAEAEAAHHTAAAGEDQAQLELCGVQEEHILKQTLATNNH